jgi:hypothetical protein
MSVDGEERLQKRLLNLVQNDFKIYSQVVGRNLIFQDEEVRIDFLLYPKQHLLDKGFDPVWFGIEVKHFGKLGETGKMSRFVWQCITYAQSEFEVNNQTIRPAFVLGYSDVEEVNKDSEREYLSQWIGMLRLAGLAKVGVFQEIKPSDYRPNGGWSIVFSSSTYFTFSKGEYSRKNYNIFKINIGNSAE